MFVKSSQMDLFLYYISTKFEICNTNICIPIKIFLLEMYIFIN